MTAPVTPSIRLARSSIVAISSRAARSLSSAERQAAAAFTNSTYAVVRTSA